MRERVRGSPTASRRERGHGGEHPRDVHRGRRRGDAGGGATGAETGRRVHLPGPRRRAHGDAAADDAGGAVPAEQGGVRGVQAHAGPGGGGES